MTRMCAYKWWMLSALCGIGLSWLPSYGIEKGAPPSRPVMPATLTTEASDTGAISARDTVTAETEDKSETSPEMSLVQQLEARAKELDERDQALADEAQRLETLRRDLEALAQEHAQAIADAAKFRDAKTKREKIDPTQESLAHLIKVYDAMDPEDAALRLEKMKEPLALDILAGIKEKKAASMLAGVEPGKAARLTEGLRHYGKNKNSEKP